MTPAAVALADTNWQFLYCSAIVITNCSQLYTVTVLTPQSVHSWTVAVLCCTCALDAVSSGFTELFLFISSCCIFRSVSLMGIFFKCRLETREQPSNRQRCYNFNASKHKNVMQCVEDYWSLVSWHNLMHFLVVAAELWLGRYNRIREHVRWGLNCS